MRILLVEDEPLLARRLERGLEEEAYAVDVAASGRRADQLVEENQYDLVILDLMLPDISGLSLLARWRQDALGVPVLILTARDSLEDKLAGFEAGADDYLTKPFAFAEMLARVRSLLRRRQDKPAEVLRFADLELDRSRHRVARGGQPMRVTPKEFALLEYLMLHPQVALGRLTLAEHVWDSGYEGRSNVIDVIVGRLRRKLEDGGRSQLIYTVRGIGYALREQAREDEA
jgi:DNA-binding response OmpR family regulator